jgi:hypothetical protein
MKVVLYYVPYLRDDTSSQGSVSPGGFSASLQINHADITIGVERIIESAGKTPPSYDQEEQHYVQERGLRER